MALDDIVPRLSEQTERDVLALYGQFERGRLTRTEFIEACAQVVAEANARAVNVADLAVAAAISRHLGRLVTPVGLEPWTADPDRLSESLETILDDEDDGWADRLGRFGRNEPVDAFVMAMGSAMTEQEVSGWIRQTEASPCPLCRDWADGVVRPPTVTMARHTSCVCHPRPVFN